MQTYTREEMINAFTSGFLNGCEELVVEDTKSNLKMGEAYALLFLEELQHDKEKLNVT